MAADSSGDQSKKSKSWLQYVTEQSWEPELLISGLAIYATLNLPDVFSKFYDYYKYNLQAGSGIFDEVLPLLIYSVFVTVAHILLAAFITHFIVRAFWVGFIGLMSVYKDGIQYENLPYSDLYKRHVKSKLGSAEEMAMKLDKVSSLVFSVAFTFVLIMVAVAILYFVFFLLYNVSKLIIEPEIFDAYAGVLYTIGLVVGIAYITLVVVLNMERFRSNPKYARWHLKLTWRANEILMPLVIKPLQFIQLTFLSHMSSKRFMTYYGILFMGFFGVLFFVIFQTLAPQILDTRNFYATSGSTAHVEIEEYNSYISENDIIENPVIESEVIQSAMMEVFIPYPKKLDELFNRLCEPVQVSDTLNTAARRHLTNEHNINCAEEMFSFSINDTLDLRPSLYFKRHPVTKQQGYQSMVDVSMLENGIHTFKVLRQPFSASDSSRKKEGRMLSFESEILFWMQR